MAVMRSVSKASRELLTFGGAYAAIALVLSLVPCFVRLGPSTVIALYYSVGIIGVPFASIPVARWLNKVIFAILRRWPHTYHPDPERSVAGQDIGFAKHLEHQNVAVALIRGALVIGVAHNYVNAISSWIGYVQERLVYGEPRPTIPFTDYLGYSLALLGTMAGVLALGVVVSCISALLLRMVTKDRDDLAEIQSGNVAIGILYAAYVVSALFATTGIATRLIAVATFMGP